MPEKRSYVAGNFVLNLDGKPCGFLKSVAGGGAVAEVVNESTGVDYVVHKHIANLKYEDIVLDLGFSMQSSLYQWIAASWEMNYQRKNGSILACDYKLEVKSEREFFNALITETTIPALDGASKDPGYITLKVAPEYTRTKKGSGKASATTSKAEQKLFLPSNFRVVIDGLDTMKVSKVDSFTVKQTVTTDDIGDARDYMKEPGRLEIPNLKFTVSEANAQSWYDWFEDFVIKGNCTEDKEKNGTLEFLSPNRQTVLATIELKNLGIFRLSEDTAKTSSDQIKRVTAELYCERMIFKPGGGKVT